MLQLIEVLEWNLTSNDEVDELRQKLNQPSQQSYKYSSHKKCFSKCDRDN